MNLWPNTASRSFSNLVVSVVSAHNGIVTLQATNDARTVTLVFDLDFLNGRAHTNIEEGGVVPTDHGGRLEDAIEHIKYQKAVIGNGQIEICLPDGAKIECEIVIPVNIDIGRTFEVLDAQIAALELQRT